jgi:hypothetical protein
MGGRSPSGYGGSSSQGSRGSSPQGYGGSSSQGQGNRGSSSSQGYSGGSSQGYGGSSSQGQGNRGDSNSQAYGPTGFDAMNETATAEIAPSTYLERSQQAFQAGNDRDAFQYLYAHFLVDNQAAAAYHINWIGNDDGPRQPGMAVRWGVGVTYIRSDGYEGPPPRLGASAEISSVVGGEGKLAVDFYAAEFGTRVLDALAGRIERGDYGEFMRMALSNASYASQAQGPQQSRENPYLQIFPGVVFVGEGQSKQLVERARQQDLDVLLVFDVRASLTRKGVPLNNTKMTLVDVTSGRDMFEGKDINNIQIDAERQKESATDPVVEAVSELFAVVDARLAMREMPDLKATHAQRRVAMLAQSRAANPLPVLVEMHYYEARRLITTEQLAQAYQQLLGEAPGAMLATGTADQREEAISRWLP